MMSLPAEFSKGITLLTSKLLIICTKGMEENKVICSVYVTSIV
jgi:hypothetical protein